MIKKRIGIFGGTFNPPHLGHIRAATAFADQMSLDELLIIPDNIPPHKEYAGSVSADDRMRMCSIAFCNIPNAKISDMEIKRGGRSYTYVTLEELSDDSCDLYFLMGTDMFLTLDSWVKPDVIFKLADICYIRRESDKEKTRFIEEKTRQYKEKYNARIHRILTDATEISSTELRKQLSFGASNGLIPDAVLSYIRSEGLYND